MSLSWDSFQLLLAVARGRTLAAAGRTLGVDASTVFRRLGALERALDGSLFERLPGGYAPTALGGSLLATAERMEQVALGLDEQLAGGAAARLSGTLRITAPDDIAHYLLLPLLASFRERHPDVELELVIDNRLLNLTRREADVAVRPTPAPPPHLFGRRLLELETAVYGLPELAGRPWKELPWVAWEEGLGPAGYRQWLASSAGRGRGAFRCASMLNQAAAASAGIGAALLPTFLGDSQPALQRLSAPVPELSIGLWVLTPAELRRRPVVRHFLDAAYRGLVRQHARLAGAGAPTGD